jgi:hypothetical protein
MRRVLFIAATLGALTWAGAAQAGTFALTGEDLSYVAPSGETNRVFLIHEEKPVRGFRLIDTGAPVTAGAGCSSVGPNEAFCPTPDFVHHILVSLDDEDDYVNTSASSSSLTRLEGGDGNDALYSGFNSSATLDEGRAPMSCPGTSPPWTTRHGRILSRSPWATAASRTTARRARWT